jgi:hypothetical protein
MLYYEPQEGYGARGKLRHGRVLMFSLNEFCASQIRVKSDLFFGSRLNFVATTDLTVRMSRFSIKVGANYLLKRRKAKSLISPFFLLLLSSLVTIRP